MTTFSPLRKPRFNVDDRVVVIGIGTNRQQKGVVAAVIEPTAGDYVFRYRVRLETDDEKLFFGFELESEQAA